jgi:hypothetical protein
LLLLVIAAFALIIFTEVPPLVKQKMWRELIAFSVFLIIGMMLSIPQALGIKIPSPNNAIEVIFRPFSGILK